ncbi:hypothetical protein AB0J83_24510 [Actinoplanes sp. NPDC049596]|uniref:hypothetical protein n=1 Tax=unclassified Actinoplanes TaxID=2626549 RepID=UPI003442AF5D
MRSSAWLKNDNEFPPGGKLFRSERRFSVWAYSVSHSQLLLRATRSGDERRIDLLFKPVEAVKTRMDYDGLVVRCATAGEREFVLRETGAAAHNRVFFLETDDACDYVVASAMGWQADDLGDRDPSALASFPPASDPARLLS